MAEMGYDSDDEVRHARHTAAGRTGAHREQYRAHVRLARSFGAAQMLPRLQGDNIKAQPPPDEAHVVDVGLDVTQHAPGARSAESMLSEAALAALDGPLKPC
eukprot:3536696-Prymnesium_polylepis.1